MARHSKQFTHALKRYLSVGKGQRRKQQWHCQVIIKESFTTTADSAEIKLIAHVDKCHPTELIHITAKRLRSAKFQAYHQLLKAVNDGEFELTPTSKITKKTETIKPFV